mgnify:CR=1 FL=1
MFSGRYCYLININATADVYRSKIGNMFEDEKSANDKLKKDVI